MMVLRGLSPCADRRTSLLPAIRAKIRSPSTAGLVAEASQLVFRKAIQPTCQSLPVVVHTGAASLALLLMHMVTQVLRLTASFLARRIAPENSPATLFILFLTRKSLIEGAASIVRTAAMLSVTINSIKVKPLVWPGRKNRCLQENMLDYCAVFSQA